MRNIKAQTRVLYSLGIVGAAIVGGWIGSKTNRPETIGDLRIDESDPDDGPYLFLELDKSSTPQSLKQKKYVTLKINTESYISHK